MWEETERSPVRPTPGFNNFAALIASSTSQSNGAKADKVQALSKKEADALCKAHEPLVLKYALKYSGNGVKLDELKAAGQLGLAKALQKFDPDRGTTFGAYAQHLVRGEILACFKPRADALAFKKPERAKAPDYHTGPALSLNTPIGKDENGNTETFIDLLPDESEPPINVDLGDLTERERRVFVARAENQTLEAIGKKEGISAERVRQIESKAAKKLPKGNIALACIRDLTLRRGYQKPYRLPRPFKSPKCPARTYTKAEIKAFLSSRPDLLEPLKKDQTWRWWWNHEKDCSWWNDRDTRPRDGWGWYWKTKNANRAGLSVLRRRGCKGPWRKYSSISEGKEREVQGLPAFIDTALADTPAWGQP